MAEKSSVADLSDGELLENLANARQEMFNLRFQLVTGQLENHARLSQVRKDIARHLTELRMREIAAADALAAEEESA